ncbi:ferric reductase-like transmembrane domain-containing protein [Candidatus Peregrinibacteria bacterium]|nr:ferric reductase-like transmembrane domain-containing protein [Candidatus Peregrinibacteria bacterium]
MLNKLIPFLLAASFLFTSPVLAQGQKDGTGVDPILESVGVEKPAEWDSWSREQKFDFLQDMGIMPIDGRYQGKADISGFIAPNTEVFNTERAEETKDNSIILYALAFLSLFIAFSGFFRNTNIIKKIGHIVSLYVLPVVLISIGIFFPAKEVFLETGFWAERMLIFLLMVKPVAVIFSSKTLMRVVTFRKELGMASFWLFLVHAAGFFVIYEMSFAGLFSRTASLWGTVAGIIMIVLAITSNKKSMLWLGSNWKKVQYLAYLALFGTLLHTSIVGNNMLKFYIVFGLFTLLKIIEWSRRKA